MMKNRTLNETKAFFEGNDRFLIFTHKKPDGDTAGSAAALCRGLRQLGKEAWIFENPQLTPRYQPYHAGLTVKTPPENVKFVSVDVAGTEMFCQGAEEFRMDYLIDHHGTNRGFAPEGWVDGKAAAAAELVMDLLLSMGVTLTREIAEPLYIALATDTGCFRYPSTSPHTLRSAALCLEAGVPHGALNHMLFETNSRARIKLNGELAKRLEFFKDGEVCLCMIPLELEQECGIREDDMEDVSNFARRIEGVELAITVRTAQDGRSKLSIRCGPGYDAGKLAQCFGGGGHMAAAGASIPAPQAEAREKILAALCDRGIL